MAYQKIYSREHWVNFPSESTAINATRLNNIESGIDAIDDRVVAMDTTKVDLTKANELVQEITYDESNGTLTITKMNGSRAVIDTKLEKLAVNFSFDEATQRLVITLDDGSKQYVDLSAFVTPLEFKDGDIIYFTINDGNLVSAGIKDGSITEKKLQPNYLADIKTESAKAVNAANAAKSSETNAASSAASAKENADKAKAYSDNIDKKTQLATFDVNDDGELIYTDNSADVFTIDDDGNLNWEVA